MGLNLFAPAPMFPLIIEDYNLSRGSVSLIMVTAFLVFTIFLIPGGIISTKLGTRGAILVSGLLMTAGVLAPVTSNLPAILPLRVAFAMGNAILLPATAAVIVQWFKTSERPIMNAVNLAAQGMGVATAMFLSVPLAEALEWRTVLMVYGVFASLGTVIWLVFGRAVQPGATSENTLSVKAIFGVIKERNTLLLSLAFVGPFAMFVSYSSWLPTYYNEEFDMPLQQASAILALLPLMGVVVNILSGFLLARLGLHRPLLMVPGLLFPIGAFGAFYLQQHSDNHRRHSGVGLLLLGIPAHRFDRSNGTTRGDDGEGSPGDRLRPSQSATPPQWSRHSWWEWSQTWLGRTVPSLSVLAILPITALIAAVKLPETGHRAKGRLSVR